MKTNGFTCAWFLTLLVAAGCGSSSSGSTSYTYSSTSTVGDYAEWTLNGNNLTATWDVTDTNGDIAKIFQVTADCGAADATYAYRICTISSSTCTDGTEPCGTSAPSGEFKMLEVPGVALFIQIDASATHPEKELHVGLLKDAGSCSADISGDYPYIRIGVGEIDIFGIYRTNSDLQDIIHGDFKMLSADQNTTPTIGYATKDGPLVNGYPDGHVIPQSVDCTNGVRTLTLENGKTIRSMASPSGLFMIDLPSGDGGLIAFKTSNAAVLADLANRSFAGLVFPDNTDPAFVTATSGALSGTSVALTSLESESPNNFGTDRAFKPLSETSWAATAPSYPDFTAAVTGYDSNTLQMTYPTPSAIPGLFVVDGTYTDSGRTVAGAMKFNGKVVIFGAVYNWRHDGTPEARLENTGAFLLFEK